MKPCKDYTRLHQLIIPYLTIVWVMVIMMVVVSMVSWITAMMAAGAVLMSMVAVVEMLVAVVTEVCLFPSPNSTSIGISRPTAL